MPVYVSIRQHTSAYVSILSSSATDVAQLLALACIRQHTSAYVSIRQHTPAYVSILSSSATDVAQLLALACMRTYLEYEDTHIGI